LKLVPRDKLILWAGIVFLPYTVLAALVPSSAAVMIALAIAFLLVAGYDGVKAADRLAGIHATLPEVVRLSTGRVGEFRLFIQNEMMRSGQVRLGLPFPPEIYSPQPDVWVALPESAVESSITWPCKALKQGCYRLDTCYLEACSPLGLWSRRAAVTIDGEFRVFPNLLMERKHLTGLFQNKGLGVHTQRQVGKGREFEQLREYMAGDSFEDIHWKATAKRGNPITKVFQIERVQEIYIFIDASRLSARDAGFASGSKSASQASVNDLPMSVLERFTIAALVMGLAADRQGDLFGIGTFDSRVRKFVRAKNGRAHYDSCRDILYTLHPASVSPDFTEVFTFISTHIRRRALLVFLTSLDDPILAENFSRHIELICRRHLVMVAMMKPALAEPLFSTPAVTSVNDIYQHLGGHMLWGGLREIEKILQRNGVGFALLENENLCTGLISRYLAIKRRQIL
jgi:uncharacterized protein (DUF58 family)